MQTEGRTRLSEDQRSSHKASTCRNPYGLTECHTVNRSASIHGLIHNSDHSLVVLTSLVEDLR